MQTRQRLTFSIQFSSSFTIRRHLTVFVSIQYCCAMPRNYYFTYYGWRQKKKVVHSIVATLLLHLLLLCERVFPLLQFSATHQAFERFLSSQYADCTKILDLSPHQFARHPPNTFSQNLFSSNNDNTIFDAVFSLVCFVLSSRVQFTREFAAIWLLLRTHCILISCSDSGRIIHFNFCIQRIQLCIHAPSLTPSLFLS